MRIVDVFIVGYSEAAAQAFIGEHFWYLLDCSYIQSAQSAASGLTFGEWFFSLFTSGLVQLSKSSYIFPVQCLRRTLPLVGATSEGPAVAGSSRVGGFLWES